MRSLINFEPSRSPITVFADARWESRSLHLRYEIVAPEGEVLFPQSRDPRRETGLWKETCFECFLGPVGQTSYFEINLAANGSWNVFEFSDYREGMKEADSFKSAMVDFKSKTMASRKIQSTLSAELKFDSASCSHLGSRVQLGLTAVLVQKNRNPTYWALRHDGVKPDFHLRSSFLIAFDLK